MVMNAIDGFDIFVRGISHIWARKTYVYICRDSSFFFFNTAWLDLIFGITTS